MATLVLLYATAFSTLSLSPPQDSESDLIVHGSEQQTPVLPFRIMPASRTAAVRWPGTSTWGMAVGFEDGWYHAFVNTMVNNCSLAAWTPNSAVVHAVSRSKLGPFEPRETVLPAFHGNPQLTRAPGGFWLLLTCGSGALPPNQLVTIP